MPIAVSDIVITCFPIQRKVCHREAVHREGDWSAVCRQVSPQAPWREILPTRHHDGSGHSSPMHASQSHRETARGVRVNEGDDHRPRTVSCMLLSLFAVCPACKFSRYL